MGTGITWSFALTVLLALPAAASGVYSWVDEEGRHHYGATPPPGVHAEQVNIRRDGSRSAPQPAARSGDDSDRLERTQHCDNARANLAVLEDSGIQQFRDENGEVFNYSAEERAELIEETQAQIAYFCRDE
ncbi:hypothetical protein CAI21_05060 [Alkalilimnicola ehrlichii]|uniref:DUF4124 domain-containing protein n=1 Tax=Alkalilimnicola ehrlichii TaxID=351052 RepID=A0A3E0X174_9GAMM|nr:DUF4124 domain-containing protein [Alkalilimnicola ehrlichii]RFA30444.1 hypothetical protein CAI21_05060 [Alkalilimnicola ehrlichii]RFA37995.1 hypothetical protein CAL65_06430 [Alkalilimnicola ehrlichii]